MKNSFPNPSFQHLSHNFQPPCRQFWKAGEYAAGDAPRPVLKSGQNRMRVHPKFLHSNATSHKWAFGAIAELLDNAVDEASNGATSVIIDNITNLGNSHALLIQDDGGGMDLESIRQCMSFGFSNKRSNYSIGQYGNGFKTSTMRLGADVIVFSRCLKERTLTQSVGMLSYTFLRQTGCDDVIVPMVDYSFDLLTGRLSRIIRRSEKHFCYNLSAILRWSPFTKEEELLNQFGHIEGCGTRIIVFNMWLNDDGDPELDFDTDEKDILISGALKVMHSSWFERELNEKHIGNRFRYSLRAYASILYLRLPEHFRIFLRSQVIDPHYIVEDLVFRQCIRYKPLAAPTMESEEIGIVIGFLYGAPHLDVRGFNIYHRSRLILPFWHVTHKCKGVVGVLQVDCLKPTHDKQDFEKSDIFHKLEIRLKCMALEYWKYHCHLVGYTATKVPSSTQPPSANQLNPPETLESAEEPFLKRRKCEQAAMKNSRQPSHHTDSFMENNHSKIDDVISMTSIGGASKSSSQCEEAAVSQPSSGITGSEHVHHNFGKSSQEVVPENEKYGGNIYSSKVLKQQSATSGIANAPKTKPQIQMGLGGRNLKQAYITMVQRRKQLNEQCMALEKSVEELTLKEKCLRSELEVVLLVNDSLCAELNSVGLMKRDRL